eukprot:Clim_evm109s147 gene=Clim_evmTU109s147
MAPSTAAVTGYIDVYNAAVSEAGSIDISSSTESMFTAPSYTFPTENTITTMELVADNAQDCTLQDQSITYTLGEGNSLVFDVSYKWYPQTQYQTVASCSATINGVTGGSGSVYTDLVTTWTIPMTNFNTDQLWNTTISTCTADQFMENGACPGETFPWVQGVFNRPQQTVTGALHMMNPDDSIAYPGDGFVVEGYQYWPSEQWNDWSYPSVMNWTADGDICSGTGSIEIGLEMNMGGLIVTMDWAVDESTTTCSPKITSLQPVKYFRDTFRHKNLTTLYSKLLTDPTTGQPALYVSTCTRKSFEQNGTCDGIAVADIAGGINCDGC